MSEIEDLKKLVSNLTSKVEALESKLLAKTGLKPAVDLPKSIRMVLIGPPGAGKLYQLCGFCCAFV